MIPLIGYSNRLSVAPEESIEFKVSSMLEEPYLTQRLSSQNWPHSST